MSDADRSSLKALIAAEWGAPTAELCDTQSFLDVLIQHGISTLVALQCVSMADFDKIGIPVGLASTVPLWCVVRSHSIIKSAFFQRLLQLTLQESEPALFELYVKIYDY